MIKIETLESGLTHTYSGTGVKIRQLDTGIIYNDAVDVIHHEYEETDEPIAQSDISDEEFGRMVKEVL